MTEEKDFRREMRARRDGWQNRGQQRPSFAVEPGPGQESVWDYPRPPALLADSRRVEVRVGHYLICSTKAAYRLLETAGAPCFYLPADDIDLACLKPASGKSLCEWKGQARYFDMDAAGEFIAGAAWRYAQPWPPYEALGDCYAFYPSKLDCRVDGERVRPQPGGFYGGWVTDDVVGPFKGEPGTSGW